MFLTDHEVAELTGIMRGQAGKTKAEMQCEHLAKVGVQFYPDARGKPKVAAKALLTAEPAAPAYVRKPQLLLPGTGLTKVK